MKKVKEKRYNFSRYSNFEERTGWPATYEFLCLAKLLTDQFSHFITEKMFNNCQLSHFINHGIVDFMAFINDAELETQNDVPKVWT